MNSSSFEAYWKENLLFRLAVMDLSATQIIALKTLFIDTYKVGDEKGHNRAIIEIVEWARDEGIILNKQEKA